jgi:hypothetical protein
MRCGGDVAELAGVRLFVRRSAAPPGAYEAAVGDLVQALDAG